MTTRERAYARQSTQQVAQYTELWIVGTDAEVQALTDTARRSGLLVFASQLTYMGGDDPRVRRYLRLRTQTRH